MPLPKGAEVLGQKEEGDKLVLYYKIHGRVHRDVRHCYKRSGEWKCPHK